MNYSLYFEDKVNNLIDYLQSNNIKAMILGISGGIDSTVCAAICHEVSKRTGIPLIGRSLPTKFNKKGETITADLVGKMFCTDFQIFNIGNVYENVLNELIETSNDQTPIANGNIQARLRMIYLYNLASIHNGVVIDTDNLTEHNLGYWTLHGDTGDVCLLHDLWKTQVFELAEWLKNWYGSYTHTYFYTDAPEVIKYKQDNLYKARAIRDSLNLKPTSGLGITDSDLDELSAESYEQVDSILQEILAWKNLALKRGDFPKQLYDQKEMFLDEQQMLNIPIEVILNVTNRHFNSEFKRKHLPIKI